MSDVATALRTGTGPAETPEQRKARLLDAELRKEEARREAKRILDAREQPREPLQVLTIAELFERPTPRYIVDQVIPEKAFMRVVGEPGTLKSFFMCHVGLSIASGQQAIFGFRVTQGPVLYIAAEGAGSFQHRIRVWCEEHGVDPLTIPFHVIPSAVNLRDPEFLLQLADAIATVKPILIICDTQARCTPGADENDTKEMGEMVFSCSEIQKHGQCAVALVHHPPKSDPTGGGRGASTVFAALDTEIRIKWADKPDEVAPLLPIVVTCAKQKDDSRFPDLELMGYPVPVLDEWRRPMAHESGRAITSIVLRPIDPAAASDRAEEAALRAVAHERDMDLKVLTILKEREVTAKEQVRDYMKVNQKELYACFLRLFQAGWVAKEKKGKPFEVTALGLHQLPEVPF